MIGQWIRSLPLLLLCISCAPAIHSFHAEPHRICAGESVLLSWEASAEGTISAQPPLAAGPGRVAAKGTTSVAPTSSVRFHLQVENLWGSAGRDEDVEVLSGRSLSIGNSVADPSANCEGRALSVSALAPADAWSAHALVGGITTLAADPHRYRVEHAGVKLELGPGESSRALSGKPIAGEWALSLTLLDGETCGTPTVPRNLGVQLIAACSKTP